MKRLFTSYPLLKWALCVLFAGVITPSKAQLTAMSFQTGYSYNSDAILNAPIPLIPTSLWYFSGGYIDTTFSKEPVASFTYKYTLVSTATFTYGLPDAGGTLTSVNAGYNYPVYNLAPANTDNVLHLEGGSYDTLMFTNQTLIGDIYLLAAAGGAAAVNANITILFTDGTTQITNSISFPNYMDSTSTLPYAIANIGRYNMTLNGGNVDGAGGRPRLFDVRVPLNYSNYGKAIAGIRVQKTGANQLNIFGACIDNYSCEPTTQVFPATAPPNPPITITSIDTIKWKSVVGSQGYEWCFETFPGASTPFTNANMPLWPSSAAGTIATTTDTMLTSATTPALNSLIPNTVYVFFVRNKCSGTSKSIWNKYSFKTPDCESPNAAYISYIRTTHNASVTWRITSPATAAIITGASNNCVGFEYALTTSNTPPTGGTTFVTYANAQAGDTAIFFPNLLTAQTYYFWIRNNCTGTSYSPWVYKQFTTLPCPSAGFPSLIPGTNVPGSAALTWPGSSDSAVIGYDFALMPGTTTPGVNDWGPVNNDTMYFNNLNPGQSYRFYLRSNCNNVTHNGFFTTFINPFYQCDTSLTLSVDNINMHGANLHWSPGSTLSPDPIQLYNIGLKVNIPFPPVNPFPANYPLPPSLPNNVYYINTTDTFFRPTNLAANTLYYFFVRTQCDTTVRPPSTIVYYNQSAWKKISFTTPDSCVGPITPTINNITPHSAHMEWNLYYGIDGYEYFIDQNPNDPQSPPPAGSWPLITYNQVDPLNLFSGTNYWFHLRTKCDATHYSLWTNTPFSTPAVCNVATPSPSLQAGTNNPTATSAIFTWAAVPDATRYEVAVTTTAAPPAVADDTITITTYNATGLTANTNYYFHIKAKCSPNDSTAWSTISFHTDFASSVANLNAKTPILVYPNPVSDDLVIDIQTNPKGTIQVIDMTGKVLYSTLATEQKTSINMKAYSTGVYMVKYMVDAEHVQIVRIQKM